jgi:hypothetical protein
MACSPYHWNRSDTVAGITCLIGGIFVHDKFHFICIN